MKKDDIKFIIWVLSTGVAIGVTMIAYAHANFTSKDISAIILGKLTTMDAKIDTLIREGR